ncbi:MAG: Uma2 family endonuclease [Planctomycetaceae bacterium]
MSREEFHRLYEQTPDHFKAELVGGTVYVASPVSLLHSRPHSFLHNALLSYESRTPGVQTLDNATVLLADESEPQPDLALRILPEHGGQSKTTPDRRYVVGAPELVIEVAYSTRSIDVHAKRSDYARNGVQEYIVWIVDDGVFARFNLVEDVEQPAGPEGILTSFQFPGLWIDGHAVREEDLARLTSTLEAGLATPEHAVFVQRLVDAKG